jgi:hypothetical protein
LVAAVLLSVTVADAPNDAQTRAPPIAQAKVQRESCLNFRETEERGASCITICFSLKQRKNPCKIKSLRGIPQPDVERAYQRWTGQAWSDSRSKLSNAINRVSADAATKNLESDPRRDGTFTSRKRNAILRFGFSASAASRVIRKAGFCHGTPGRRVT